MSDPDPPLVLRHRPARLRTAGIGVEHKPLAFEKVHVEMVLGEVLFGDVAVLRVGQVRHGAV